MTKKTQMNFDSIIDAVVNTNEYYVCSFTRQKLFSFTFIVYH